MKLAEFAADLISTHVPVAKYLSVCVVNDFEPVPIALLVADVPRIEAGISAAAAAFVAALVADAAAVEAASATELATVARWLSAGVKLALWPPCGNPNGFVVGSYGLELYWASRATAVVVAESKGKGI
jgi:hypothetical protein